MTPEKRAAVTPEVFEGWVRDVIQENPERVNPITTRGRGLIGQCLYTDPDDPSYHCLIGEVLARHDPDVLPPVPSQPNWGMSAYGLLEQHGYEPEVCRVGGAYQGAADGWGHPRPWREVPAIVRPPIPPEV